MTVIIIVRNDTKIARIVVRRVGGGIYSLSRYRGSTLLKKTVIVLNVFRLKRDKGMVCCCVLIKFKLCYEIDKRIKTCSGCFILLPFYGLNKNCMIGFYSIFQEQIE